MSTELVYINTDTGQVKIITPEGVEDDQQVSVNDAYAKVAYYVDLGYEVISASGTSYTLKKPVATYTQRVTIEK